MIGFGSMTGLDAKKTMAIIMEAARRSTGRVVVQSGWAGLSADDLPKNMHIASFVPHDWLFARASCVVHHGGAGTTAARAMGEAIAKEDGLGRAVSAIESAISGSRRARA